ncbi:MAG: SpoIVB peptidase [Firmicutes bacterium]|nr:SpoIVB peptidase [Bacillota bacterium]
MIKKTFLSILLFFFFVPNISAYSNYIIASGENIGIELKSKGVIITGFYKVNDKNVASEAGLKVGDRILSINDETVNSSLDISNIIKKSNGNIKIDYERNNKRKSIDIKLEKDNSNIYKTGIYVKDSISGIGTLTYIDPNTKLYGALGHEIIENTTKQIFEISDGNIYKSEVTGIEPSESGTPGEKNANVDYETKTGSINENTIKGIFGTYTEEFDTNKLYKVAKPNEIKKGEAKILTVLDGEEVKEYKIKILKINKSSNIKNISFEIIDEELLSKTNGIIQGMSGSPIIQGDNIIGAVTHVVVDDPHKGYGIFITTMLEEAEN